MYHKAKVYHYCENEIDHIMLRRIREGDEWAIGHISKIPRILRSGRVVAAEMGKVIYHTSTAASSCRKARWSIRRQKKGNGPFPQWPRNRPILTWVEWRLALSSAAYRRERIETIGGKREIETDTVQPFLSIVIPAYNEERRLPESLNKIMAFLQTRDYPAEVIVVDDGSTDDTVDVVEGFIARYSSFSIIKNDHRGKGYAVRTGMLAARGTCVLFSDADLATPIDEVDRLLAFLEDGYDIAIGSREGMGAQRINEPGYRHLMGRFFNLLVRLVAVGGFQDTQCGFKCFRREVAQDLFQRVQLYGAEAGLARGGMVTGFDVEVLFLALKSGYKVKEVPVQWHYGANTKVNPLLDSVRMFMDVLRVRLNHWRGRYN